MLDTLKDFFGIENRYEDDEDYQEYDLTPEQTNNPYPDSSVPARTEFTPTPSPNNRKKQEVKMSNVIGMPGLTNGNSEVIVVEPHSFEEMPQVIQALRERKSVVLNLNVMNPDEAQRAVDFIAGGTYAMDGHQERVGESIFLFTPSCVKVSSLSGIIHDVQNHEPHIRRPAPSPSVWGEPTAIAQ
ncbi:MAG: cell division protein SepF [Pleurocapsa sp.]